MERFRLNNWIVWLGFISLVPFGGMSQADTLSKNSGKMHGVIRVQRPDIKPEVEVIMKYRPVQSHWRKRKADGVAFLNDGDNKKTNGLIYPEPFYISNQDREKYMRMSSTSNVLYFDLDSFFSENLAYKYPWVSAPRVDTVRLVASITKEGKAEYSYLTEHGQKKQIEKKCFETLGLILGWVPAREVRYSAEGTRIRRSKKVHCYVDIMIILHAQQPGLFLVEDSLAPN